MPAQMTLCFGTGLRLLSAWSTRQLGSPRPSGQTLLQISAVRCICHAESVHAARGSDPGFTALTQDVDIVWRRNAIEYLANISTGRETLMMVEAGQRYKKVKSCFDNLGPGLIYTQPTRESRQILGAWFDQCPEMETRRANAPFFQSAARNLSSCGYDGQESTGSKPHASSFSSRRTWFADSAWIVVVTSSKTSSWIIRPAGKST